MKKGYYIHEPWIGAGPDSAGCTKKIKEEQNVLSTIMPVEELAPEMRGSKTIGKILKRIPFGPSAFQWKKLALKTEDAAFLYIRKPTFCREVCDFLKEVRRRNPDVKILIEIPTYPYDKELFTNRKNLPMYPNEVYYRNQLHKYVDRIVTFSDDDEIFGIPTIKVQNGIDVAEQPVRSAKTDTSEIHLIAVALFQPYHGYERIIKGIAEYYREGGTREVILDMVGGGSECSNYQALAKELEIEDHVTFWGIRRGEELAEVFERADIGLGSFGFFKIGLEVASSLKLREYLARGLPVVAGSKQDLFTEDTFPYYLEFPNNGSAVDIEQVIEFYDRIYLSDKSYDQVIRHIRIYAEENVTWEKTFASVVNYLAY